MACLRNYLRLPGLYRELSNYFLRGPDDAQKSVDKGDVRQPYPCEVRILYSWLSYIYIIIEKAKLVNYF